jgi:hypothetical protein
MATTKYPTGIDTDAEIPRADNAITPVDGDVFNALRSAVFAIEKALGSLPQGAMADLAARLGVSLDANGNIKASALSGIGLVTLPITNAQVGTNAGIDESKLRLNYATVQLKAWIDSLAARVDLLEAAVADDIANLTQHIHGLWGRHDSGQVDAYGVFAGRTVQGALTNLDTRLDAHISDPVGAHAGSAISLDSSRFDAITATDVQTAVEQLESIQLLEIVDHRDLQHGNGILDTQDVLRSGTRFPTVIVPPSAGSPIIRGTSVVSFASPPPSIEFSAIARNDRLDLVSGGRRYTFVVDGIPIVGGSPSTSSVNIFGFVPVSMSSPTIAVYRNPEETSEPSVAMVAARRASILNRPSVLQLVHPSAPFILGNGFNGSALPVPSFFRMAFAGGVHGGVTDDLQIGAAMSTSPSLSGTPSRWTVEQVAAVINAQLFAPDGSSAPRYPLVAFPYLGELGIAYDNPDADGYVQIMEPTSPLASALPSLGFSPPYNVEYNSGPRHVYIDGYDMAGVHKLLDATGVCLPTSTLDFTGAGVDLLASGLKDGALVHVERTGVPAHPYDPDNGTYVAATVSQTQLVFDTTNEHAFAAPSGATFRVRAWADHFSQAVPPQHPSLYELFLDGYADSSPRTADFLSSKRVEYADQASGGSSLDSLIDIVAVSRQYASASRRLRWDSSAHTLTLGSPALLPTGIVSTGEPVFVKGATTGYENGLRVRLYDHNGVDYIDLVVVGTLPGSSGTMNITIQDPISEERFLQVATVLHDTSELKWLGDRRLFGTVGRHDVRDDFIRDHVSYPISRTRGCGVLQGFLASGIGTTTLTVSGGEVLVDGRTKSIPGRSFTIPDDGASNTEYNLFVDRDGVMRLWLENYTLSDPATPTMESLLASGTETVLWQILVDPGTRAIQSTGLLDLRRFVNRIDDKADLTVDDFDGYSYGSFSSLKAAANYIGAHLGGPVSARIKIRGNVAIDDIVELPENTFLEGAVRGDPLTSMVPTLTFSSPAAMVALATGCQVENLKFRYAGTGLNGFMQNSAIPVASDIGIRRCSFVFDTLDASNFALVFDHLDRVVISDCVFQDAGTALNVTGSSDNSRIEDNIVDGMAAGGIKLLGDVNYVNVSGNILTASTIGSIGASTAFILFGGDINLLTVSSNTMVYSGTDTPVADTAMLNIKNIQTTADLIVERNCLVNNAAIGQGFAVGILCQPNPPGWSSFGPFVSTPGERVTIYGNKVFGFMDSADGYGIKVFACARSIVAENLLVNCKKAIVSGGISGDGTVICGNNILLGSVTLSGTNMGVQTDTDSVVVGNYIASADGSGRLCSLGGGSIMSGNLLRLGVSSPITSAMVSCDGDNCAIIGNRFKSNSGNTVTGSVIDISSNNNLITGNNLSINVAPPPGGNYIYNTGSFTGNADVLNKGQTYSVTIPVSWAKESRLESGISSWQSVTLGFNATSTIYDAGAPDIVFAFGESVVPAGATVNSIEILYNLSGGDTSKLQMAWYLERGFPSALSTIHTLGNVAFADGVSHVETLLPTTTPGPIYTQHGDTHRLSIVLVAGGIWTATIYEFQVNFTL